MTEKSTQTSNHPSSRKYEGEWENCLSATTIKEGRIHITSGCAEWIDYILKFSRSNDFPKEWDSKLYKDCCMGSFYLENKILVLDTSNDKVKLVGRDYEKKGNEIYIDYDFFNWIDYECDCHN